LAIPTSDINVQILDCFGIKQKYCTYKKRCCNFQKDLNCLGTWDKNNCEVFSLVEAPFGSFYFESRKVLRKETSRGGGPTSLKYQGIKKAVY